MEGQVRKTDNTMTSRQPFRNIKQSPWRGGSEKEKKLTDNLRVLVKPTTSLQTNEERSKEISPTSPVRTMKPHLKNRSRMSPWRRRTEESDEEPRMTLHHSEISIFQQLCLDKHDEEAAIEILLDSSENTNPEIYTEPSGSMDHISQSIQRKKAGSVEGRRKFLNRFFSKSQRKSPTEFASSSNFLGTFKESNNSMSHSSSTSDEPTDLTAPSSVPTTRITVENNTFPETSNISWAAYTEGSTVEKQVERTRSILDDFREGGDTVSNISSLSGSRASSYFTSVNFNRQESLGFESIKDIRKCLKEMELQLGQATNKGQRVSRQKVMRALFTVAESLEDDEEKSHLKKELKTSMENRKEEVMQSASSKPLKLDSGDEDKSELTTSDDEEFTLDSGKLEAVDEDTGANESPFNIVSSVGNFFGVDLLPENEEDVKEIMEDLFFTEFVSERQQKTNKKKSTSTYSRSKTRSDTSRKSSAERKKYNESPAKKDRSWWRNHTSNEEDEEDEDEDEDYSSSSSEDEFKYHLPPMITVKKKVKKPTTVENSVKRSISNPHYRVKLVDTESRLGYEMDPKSRRSPVI